MKQTVLKTTVAVLGAGLVSYLGTLAVPMLVLLGVMLLDYITGMIKAYIRAELNSKFGITVSYTHLTLPTTSRV